MNKSTNVGHGRGKYTVEDRAHETPCWIWLGSKAKSKLGIYPTIRLDGRIHRAHRVYYERAVGAIPEGMVLHHDCETTLCVRPSHCRPLWQSEHAAYHARRLSDVERQEIVRLYGTSNLSGEKIGKQFGVSQGYVSHLGTQANISRQGKHA